MKITKHVDIPEEILIALEEGTLVVFAGAGVSIPKPSLLPNFAALAEIIGKNASTKGEDEELDVYLGRLKTEGVEVHKITKEILSNKKSKPTSWHKALVSLFKTPQSLKIVTTNFDNHFSTVVKKKFKNINTYYAPALPLGDKFSGLVYLHGNILRPDEDMVLTDADFGVAYLTRSWASRFLFDMFTNYTVLFVGYGNNDPIMRYLGSGLALSRETKRYALVKAADSGELTCLGIKPIVFPEYENCGEALEALAAYVNMDILEHDAKIKQIIKNESQDLLDLDYMDKQINKPTFISVFCDNAKSIYWLMWISTKSQFIKLFEDDLGKNTNEITKVLSYWLVDNFLKDNSDAIFDIMQKNSFKLNHILWSYIAHKLRDKDINEETVIKWVTTLIDTYNNSYTFYADYLVFILDRYKHIKINNNIFNNILSIFDFAITPRICLKSKFGETEKTQGEIGFAVDKHRLGDFQKIFKDEYILENYIERLEHVIYYNIVQAVRKIRNFKDFNAYDEAFLESRRILLSQEDDYYPNSKDILIDISIDIMNWLAIHKPDYAIATIEKWQNSSVPILVRIAIYGMRLVKNISPDDKAKWLIERKLWFLRIAIEESVGLLKSVYTNISEDTEKLLIKEIMEYDLKTEYTWMSDEEIERLRYSWLYTFSTWSPESIEVQTKLKEMSAANSSLDECKGSLDIKRTTIKAEWVSFKSPLSAKALLEKDMQTIIATFEGLVDSLYANKSSYGLVDAVSNAICEKDLWGLELAEFLAENSIWRKDIWRGIYNGWGRKKLTGDEWDLILNISENENIIADFADNFANFILEKLSEGNKHLSEDHIAKIEGLALRMLIANIYSKDEATDIDGDALTFAINHKGGKLTQIMIKCLHKKFIRKNISYVSGVYKDYFELLLKEDSYTALMGQVVLAAYVRTLFTIDYEWTKNKILPMFSWQNNTRAKMMWEGFLQWGTWSNTLFKIMLPYTEECFARLNNDLIRLKDRFCEHIALVAVYGSEHPIKSDWFYKFLNSLDSASRETFADYIFEDLEKLDDSKLQNIWAKWLKQYLKDRIDGKPVRLDSQEVLAIAKWSITMHSKLPEFVDLIKKMPAPTGDILSFYWSLPDCYLLKEYPEKMAELLLLMLKSKVEDGGYIAVEKLEEIFNVLKENGTNRLLLEDLIKELRILGVSSERAVELMKMR